jgi:hypothetical protein
MVGGPVVPLEMKKVEERFVPWKHRLSLRHTPAFTQAHDGTMIASLPVSATTSNFWRGVFRWGVPTSISIVK